MVKNALITVISLLLLACATGRVEPTAKNAAWAISHARAAQRQAAAVGYEWRDTGQLIDDARKAAKNSQFARAIALAQQAERQSQAALDQFIEQKNAAHNY